MEIFPKIIIAVDSFLSLIKSIFGATSTPLVITFFYMDLAHSTVSLCWLRGLGQSLAKMSAHGTLKILPQITPLQLHKDFCCHDAT